jgi:hypothetical protein
MKLYRNLAILLVVVIILAGAYMLLDRNSGSSNDAAESSAAASSAEEEGIKVLDLKEEDMVKVTLVNEGETFVMEKRDAGWLLTAPSDLKADSSKVAKIPETLASVKASKVVAENITDDKLADYGLDKPSELTCLLKDGTEKILQFGSETPTKSGFYARLKGEGTVYVVDVITAGSLLAGRDDLRDENVLALQAEDIISLSMDKRGESFFKAVKSQQGTWGLTSPVSHNANGTAMEAITSALAGTVTYTEFVESNPSDLGQYGLATPEYAFDIETSTGSYKLLLGKEKVRGSQAYAKLGSSSEVFTIDISGYTFLDKPIDEIVEAYVYLPDIINVTKMDLSIDGRTTAFGLEIYKDSEGNRDSSKDKFSINGTDVTALKDSGGNQLFRNFYQALTGISHVSIDKGAVPSGPADITITYYLNNAPGKVKVEYVPKDADSYYAVIDGKYTGLVVPKDGDMGVAAMKASYDTLMAAAKLK